MFILLQSWFHIERKILYPNPFISILQLSIFINCPCGPRKAGSLQTNICASVRLVGFLKLQDVPKGPAPLEGRVRPIWISQVFQTLWMYFHTIGIKYKTLAGVSKSYSCLMTTQWSCQAMSEKQVTGSCCLTFQSKMGQFQGEFAGRPLLRTEGSGPTCRFMLQPASVSSSKMYLLLTHRQLRCFTTVVDTQLSSIRVPLYVLLFPAVLTCFIWTTPLSTVSHVGISLTLWFHDYLKLPNGLSGNPIAYGSL